MVNESVTFTCSISIAASIKVAGDINAWNINAWNINAGNINTGDINAWNIVARDINAGDISFYAVASAHVKFICKSIVGRRENSRYFCLDSEVEIKQKEEIKP